MVPSYLGVLEEGGGVMYIYVCVYAVVGGWVGGDMCYVCMYMYDVQGSVV